MMLSLTVPGRHSDGALGQPAGPAAPVAMIAATAQLNVSLSATAELAAALRIMAKLSLPALVAPQFMANLTASLSAAASLQLAWA